MEKYWVEFSYYDAGSDYDMCSILILTFEGGKIIKVEEIKGMYGDRENLIQQIPRNIPQLPLEVKERIYKLYNEVENKLMKFICPVCNIKGVECRHKTTIKTSPERISWGLWAKRYLSPDVRTYDVRDEWTFKCPVCNRRYKFVLDEENHCLQAFVHINDKVFSEGQYIRKGEYHLFKLAVNVLKELEIKVIER